MSKTEILNAVKPMSVFPATAIIDQNRSAYAQQHFVRFIITSKNEYPVTTV